MKKIILLLIISIFLSIPIFVFAVENCNETQGVCSPAGTDTVWTVEGVAIRYIKIGLGFIGVIALLFFIYAGFLWMTAQGKPDIIKKARDIMIWAVLGIVVILSSYSILGYVFDSIIF